MNRLLPNVLALAFAASTVAGCANMTETPGDTAKGAGIGAVAGAVIGGVAGGSRGAGTGAAIGAAIGAGGATCGPSTCRSKRRWSKPPAAPA